MNRISAPLLAVAAAVVALPAYTGALAEQPAQDACNASEVRPWIGKRATPMIRADIARATGAKSVRWLYPDSRVTMDYNPNRLNVRITKATGMIRSAKCG